jgi:hypothetical protein
MEHKLEIIATTTNKPYISHNIDGEKVIGVFENEPFKIKFTNDSWKKVQIRVSVDGTDILTGELASTEPEGKMFLVNPFDTIELCAWPEDNNGGAEFLFGTTKNSVAANTHGNLSAKGLIAVAIFEESESERRINYFSKSDPLLRHCKNKSLDDDCLYECSELGPAVGAGNHREQKLVKTAGLNKPKFAEIVQIRYEWWDKLHTKLRHPAFPGDQKNINLGKTPRIRREDFRRF